MTTLQERVPAPRGDGDPGARWPQGSAAAELRAYLARQVEELVAAQPLVGQGDPEAVHRMRLAVRRIRATLGTFGDLFDRRRTEPLRQELRWLGGVVAPARDLDATREHLRAAIAAEPGELVLGPVAARVLTALGSRYRNAEDAAAAELAGERSARLLESLRDLVDDPPFSRAARRPAAKVLPARVARAWKRVQRRHRRVAVQPDAARRDPQLHRLRQAARRARYAAEVARPVAGPAAGRFAARLHAVQRALGEHQDSVVIRERLRELGVAAHLDGENGFTYGRLHALEQARADRTLQEFGAAWASADRRKVRRWMER